MTETEWAELMAEIEALHQRVCVGLDCLDRLNHKLDGKRDGEEWATMQLADSHLNSKTP